MIIVSLITAFVQTGILLGVALALFRIQVVGVLAAIIGIVVFGTLSFIALGYVFGAIAPSAQALIAIVQMVQFPYDVLSGALFPLDFLPEFLHPLPWCCRLRIWPTFCARSWWMRPHMRQSCKGL